MPSIFSTSRSASPTTAPPASARSALRSSGAAPRPRSRTGCATPASGSCRHRPPLPPAHAPPRHDRRLHAFSASAAAAAAAPRAPPLARLDQVDQLAPLGHLGLARGEHLLLLGHRLGARLIGRRLRIGLRLRLLCDGDGALLLGELHALRRAISAACTARSLPMRSCSEPARSGSAPARPSAARLICALSASCSLSARSRARSARCARPRDLHFALLLQPRVLASRSMSSAASPLPGSCCGSDQRVLLDVVALLLARLDLLGQPRQTLGVERVARVEELHRGLVELRQRGRFELQAILEQVFRDHRCAPAGRSRRASRAAPPSSSRRQRCAARRRTCPRAAPSAARAAWCAGPASARRRRSASGSACTRT